MQSLQTSVEQFADDVRRYQQGLPVTARRGTRGYLAKKFLARNKALSFAVVCSCSRFLPVRQWPCGRRTAPKWSGKALSANSLIFELYAGIAPLRGSREARELMLRRGTEMLDGLAKEAANDASLDLELAAGYRRLGDVQGNPLSENRGDTRAALRSYQEAIRLGKAALAKDPASQAAKMDLASSYQNLSSFTDWQRRRAQSAPQSSFTRI